MRLFLIRHGAVVPPAPGAVYGGAEVPLSEAGQAQARSAALALAAIKLDHLIASPLARARYGALQIASGRGLVPEFDDALREIDHGRWLGLTLDQIRAKYPADLDSQQRDLANWRGHSGESLGDLSRRVLDVRDRLLGQWRGKSVALVSHLGPTRAILADARGLKFAKWTTLMIPTASVSMLDFPLAARPRVGWTGYQPDGLCLRKAYPHHF